MRAEAPDVARAARDPEGGSEAARAAPPPTLSLDSLEFAYPDGTEVLAGIDLEVGRGEIVGVVGPSGGGKSTLLALIAGLLEPTSGRVVRHLDDSGRHPLSMVFQKDTLLPWLTVEENARSFERFGGRRGRRRRAESAAEVDERVASLLELAQLADSANKYPYQLSGGMRRRLAFVAAAAVNPQILLLDEPFSSVDEPTRVGIHQDVFRIARMLEMTCVLVTHDLGEAVTLCDRVVILSARPARIAESHRTPFGDDRRMLELRDTPEFLELYGKLWHGLSEQIAAGKRGA